MTIELPNQISATSIERLIKDPYEFWLQNILKIRPLESLEYQSRLKDYGVYVHKVIELYSTPDYHSHLTSSQNRWQTISEELINEMQLCETTAALWRPKIAKTYLLFSQFLDNNSGVDKAYIELAGARVIDLGYRNITVTSVADRIEIDQEGNITIIDFKTGTIPTKDEVNRGYAVQILIEAIILAGNGFENIKYNGHDIRCLYVRLGSQLDSPEYLEVLLTSDDIEAHYRGLQDLLTDYDNTKLEKYSSSI